MTIKLESTVLKQGGKIETRHTCDGGNISIPLNWSVDNSNIKSFAITCEDPDAPAGVFTHWILFNIPSDVKELSAGITNENELENGAKQGINDFGKIGYGGPCPPSGPAHRFIFKIYSLDSMLDLESGATKDQLLKAMEGHVLDEGQLIGIYGT